MLCRYGEAFYAFRGFWGVIVRGLNDQSTRLCLKVCALSCYSMAD